MTSTPAVVKSKDKPKTDTKKLYEDACNPVTTEADLLNIWNSTTSAKVRKAITSNPNISAELLKTASRLYLDEALENPAFELLKIFTDDKWINNITRAYEDPAAFAKSISYYTVRRHSTEIKAALASDKITLAPLSFFLENAPAPDLTRAVKNARTKDRLSQLILNEIDENHRGIKNTTVINCSGSGLSKQINLSPRACFMAMKLELISEDEALVYFKDSMTLIKNFGRGAFPYRVDKNLISNFISYSQKKFVEGAVSEQEKITSIDLITEVVGFCGNFISQSSIASSLRSAIPYFYASDSKGGALLEYTAELFKGIRYNVSSDISTNCLGHFSAFFLDAYRRKILNKNSGKENLLGFYEFIRSFNLERDFCEHHESIGSSSSGGKFRILQALNSTASDLDQLPMEVKLFYVKAICSGSLIRLERGSEMYDIVNEVNDEIFYNHGKICSNLLFDRANLNGSITVC